MNEISIRKIAIQKLVLMNFPVSNLPEITRIEKLNNGWHVYYQSSVFIKTGDINYSYVGNAPIFIKDNADEINSLNQK